MTIKVLLYREHEDSSIEKYYDGFEFPDACVGEVFVEKTKYFSYVVEYSTTVIDGYIYSGNPQYVYPQKDIVEFCEDAVHVSEELYRPRQTKVYKVVSVPCLYLEISTLEELVQLFDQVISIKCSENPDYDLEAEIY